MESNQDAEVLEWAKARLGPYLQVKITNLHSSWQNGMGFCALIHSRYPDLIQMEALKPREVEANFNLTLEACQAVGVNIPNLLQDLKLSTGPGLNSQTTVRFLAELRSVFDRESAPLSQSQVEAFRARVMDRRSRSEDDSTSSLPTLSEKAEESGGGFTSHDEDSSATEAAGDGNVDSDAAAATPTPSEQQRPNRRRALMR